MAGNSITPAVCRSADGRGLAATGRCSHATSGFSVTERLGLSLLLQLAVDRRYEISATRHPDNHASARLLQKAGLEYEGRIRSHLLVRGAWRDSLLYAVLNSDD